MLDSSIAIRRRDPLPPLGYSPFQVGESIRHINRDMMHGFGDSWRSAMVSIRRINRNMIPSQTRMTP